MWATKWNFSMANRFYDNAIKPAFAPAKGQPRDWRPLLLATLGAFASGALILELLEKLGRGKEPHVPDFTEAMSGSQPIEDITMHALYLMQLAGYAGEYGKAAQFMSEALKGNNKDYLTFPLMANAEAARQTLVDVADAVGRGEQPPDVMLPAIGDFLKDSLGQYRELKNQYDRMWNEDERTAKTDYRAWRVYNRVMDTGDLPGTDMNASYGNPLYMRKAKELKAETDVQKMPELAASVIDDSLRRSEGDPMKFGKAVKYAMSDHDGSIPSPETNWPAFVAYGAWYKQTYGEEAWTNRVRRLGEFKAQRDMKKALLLKSTVEKYDAGEIGLDHLLHVFGEQELNKLIQSGRIGQR